MGDERIGLTVIMVLGYSAMVLMAPVRLGLHSIGIESDWINVFVLIPLTLLFSLMQTISGVLFIARAYRLEGDVSWERRLDHVLNHDYGILLAGLWLMGPNTLLIFGSLWGLGYVSNMDVYLLGLVSLFVVYSPINVTLAITTYELMARIARFLSRESS
ncbi:hypothetical protein [Bremerella sp. P1]|uniref:hypothetical protein n=1 Tax=Bremerella sp. P1 TaxID=3026424 RepID=UPI002367B032|nr:hypothetical protein [Bremerella sp. P1]WDI43624.1 hypothetical protein PSR63_06655 [Bremerella sp. P1]